MSIPNSKEQAAGNKTNSNEQIANSKARYNNLNFALCSLLFVICFLAITGCGPDPFYIPTVFIEGVPEIGTAGTPLALTATVRPVFASNKDIIWSVKNAETTGAVISGNILNADADGTVIITARIPNGKAEGKDYTQDFIIVIGSGAPITDKDKDKEYTIVILKSGDESDDAVTPSPDKGVAGDTVTLTYTVANTKHYNQLDFGGVSATIASVEEAGTGTRTYVINVADSADDVITITAIFEHTDLVIDPTYSISLSTSGTYMFTAVEYGYGAQSPLTVTVTNTGNQATGALDIALSGANSGSFTLLKTSITTIATGGSDTFTVSPATGLALGTYTTTVTISGGNGITASFDISFTVHDITAPTLTLDNIIRQSDTLAMVSFTTNEAGTAYYLVQNVGVAAPTSAQVKAGTSLGAVDYGANSNKAVTLTAGAKDIYVVVEDAAGNISEPLKIEAEAHVTIIRVDGTPIVGDLITIGTNDTVTLTTEKTYESYRWSVNGVAQTGETKTEYTFYASGRQVDKTYAIVVLVFKDGVPYSKAITIRIQS